MDTSIRAPLVAQMVKNLSEMQDTQVQPLGWEDPLEEEMKMSSSNLALRIPWTQKPVGLESMSSQRVRSNNLTTNHTFSEI